MSEDEETKENKNTLPVRVDRSLLEAIDGISGKRYGNRTSFIRTAIENELSRTSGILSVCESCLLTSDCKIKTANVKPSCKFRKSKFGSFECGFCENWVKDKRSCKYIASYPKDFFPSENDKCWINPFQSTSFDANFEQNLNNTRIKVRAGIILKQNIFRVVSEIDPEQKTTPETPKKDHQKGKKKKDDQEIDPSTLEELKKHTM